MPDQLSKSQKKALKLLQIKREYAKQLNELFEEVYNQATQVRKSEEEKKLNKLAKVNTDGS